MMVSTYAGHTLAEIKNIAEAAKPSSPWGYNGNCRYGVWSLPLECYVLEAGSHADADFVAAANPATVLALVERIEELDAQRDELLAALFAIANAERLSVTPNPAVMMEHARFAIASAKGGAA